MIVSAFQMKHSSRPSHLLHHTCAVSVHKLVSLDKQTQTAFHSTQRMRRDQNWRVRRDMTWRGNDLNLAENLTHWPDLKSRLKTPGKSLTFSLVLSDQMNHIFTQHRRPHEENSPEKIIHFYVIYHYYCIILYKIIKYRRAGDTQKLKKYIYLILTKF